MLTSSFLAERSHRPHSEFWLICLDFQKLRFSEDRWPTTSQLLAKPRSLGMTVSAISSGLFPTSPSTNLSLSALQADLGR